ncbi:DUF1845 family protein [Ralstonia pseudosolanacearum]|nr:DUF1845 family protein [Ralstonia pseudosolanacearum]
MVPAHHAYRFDAPSSPQTNKSTKSGLKPIARLTGEERIKRIVPETAASTEVTFSSMYVRNFLRSAYNFCSSKFSVAHTGKIRAVDDKFREAEDWFERAIAWHATKSQVQIPMETETVEVQITHPLSGRLVRLLNQYDKLFSIALFARVANAISPGDFERTMDAANSKIGAIHQVCIPDNDRFAADGEQTGESSLP